MTDKAETKQKTYTQDELNKEITRALDTARNKKASVDVSLHPVSHPGDRFYAKIEIRGGDPTKGREYVRQIAEKMFADMPSLDAD